MSNALVVSLSTEGVVRMDLHSYNWIQMVTRVENIQRDVLDENKWNSVLFGLPHCYYIVK